MKGHGNTFEESNKETHAKILQELEKINQTLDDLCQYHLGWNSDEGYNVFKEALDRIVKRAVKVRLHEKMRHLQVEIDKLSSST